jgi:hypothetical protein
VSIVSTISVHPSAVIGAAPNGRISPKFDIGKFYEKYVEGNPDLFKI